MKWKKRKRKEMRGGKKKLGKKDNFLRLELKLEVGFFFFFKKRTYLPPMILRKSLLILCM